MTIKQTKRILYFLKAFMVNIESNQDNSISPELLHLFSKKELVQMVQWLYGDYDKNLLIQKTVTELSELIYDDANVLAHVIEQLESSINAVPKLTQAEVYKFFEKTPSTIHYLRDKPIETWDAYDISNYYSLLFKHGKTSRVFAIYTSDIKEEDKYIIPPEPSLFFDTKEEAEKEVEELYEAGTFTKGALTIQSLWRMHSTL